MVRATRSSSKRNNSSEKTTPKRDTKRSKTDYASMPVEHESHGKVPGKLYVWGQNDFGQLGLGQQGEDVEEKVQPFPLRIGSDLKILDADTGGMHTIALAEDGSVWTWGTNDEGELGRKTDGSAWGIANPKKGEDSTIPAMVNIPKEAGRVLQVCAGDGHSFFLTDKGDVWGFGRFRNSEGSINFSPDVEKQLLPARVYHTDNPAKQAIRISSGVNHVAALLKNGTVVTWGDGEHGQLGRFGPRALEGRRSGQRQDVMLTPQEVRIRDKVVDAMCGWHSTFLITQSGKVFVMGCNNRKQLGVDKEDSIQLFTPVQPSSLQNRKIQSFSSGRSHTLACTKDGEIFSFGCVFDGRLGLAGLATDSGKTKDIGVPTQVEAGSVPSGGVAVGDVCSGCFTREDGKMWTWGGNDSFLLAKGNESADEPLPREVQETPDFSQRKVIWMGFGGQHAACLSIPRNEI